MTTKTADYYDENSFLYPKKTRSLHCGIWDENTKNLSEAYINTNRIVCESIDINKNDKVLDAGCGIGGTSLYIAENLGAKVIGITVSNKQIEEANSYKEKSKAKDKLQFLNRDFTDTKFPANHFDKVFAIESFCGAKDKKDVLKESYRILKPGGKIAVLDGFLIKRKLTEKDQKYYQGFLKGFTLSNLAHRKDFEKDMKKVGFKNIHYKSYVNEIRRSTKRYYRTSLLTYPLALVLSKLKLFPKSTPDHFIAVRNIEVLLDRNISGYGLFIATK